MINFKCLSTRVRPEFTRSFYTAHKHEIDSDLTISDERASFIVKTFIAGMTPHIYTHMNRVVSGFEILAALKRLFDEDLVFTGNLYEQINGKTYKELPAGYRGMIEEMLVEDIQIGYDSKPDDVEYFIETIGK